MNISNKSILLCMYINVWLLLLMFCKLYTDWSARQDFHSRLSVIGLHLKVKDVFSGYDWGVLNVWWASNWNFIIGWKYNLSFFFFNWTVHTFVFQLDIERNCLPREVFQSSLLLAINFSNSKHCKQPFLCFDSRNSIGIWTLFVCKHEITWS